MQVKHENYIRDAESNDIALMRLEDPAVIDTYTQTIGMATPSDGDFAFVDCVIIGWGRDEYKKDINFVPRDPPSILQEAKVPATSNKNCQLYWLERRSINDGHICVGIPEQAGGCLGDSGGPLVCPDASGSYVLVGATSFGPSDCSPIWPTVYARVSYYREWIRRNSGL